MASTECTETLSISPRHINLTVQCNTTMRGEQKAFFLWVYRVAMNTSIAIVSNLVISHPSYLTSQPTLHMGPKHPTLEEDGNNRCGGGGGGGDDYKLIHRLATHMAMKCSAYQQTLSLLRCVPLAQVYHYRCDFSTRKD